MTPDAPRSERFSLMNGGPAYRLMTRLGLGPSVVRRAVVFAAVTWLPLLILSALHGVALGNRVGLPFLLDIAAHARFLVAVPLLILTERIVDRWLAPTVSEFTESNLIREDEVREYESLVGTMIRRRDAVLPEVLLLILAFGGSLSVGRMPVGELTTWHGVVWWYSLISVPIFQFLFLRWLWRFGIWCAFLRGVSRLDLQVVGTHPDLRGGLGFLSIGHAAFFPIVLSASVVASGIIAVSVVYAGVQILSYLTFGIVLVLLVVLLFVGPLFLFTPRLIRLKIASILSYGELATRYTQMFHRKWVLGEQCEDSELLGSADIQSLADLSTSFGLVNSMRLVPFGLSMVLAYLLSVIVPLLPLAFLVVPADEVGRALLNVFRAILG